MNKLYKLLKILLMAFAVISLGKSLFGCIQVQAQVQNGDQLVRVTPDNWDYVNAGGLGTFNVSSGVAFVDFIVSFEDLSVEKGKTYHASFNFYGGLSDGFYSFDSQLWDFSSDNQPIQIYNLTMTGSGNYRNIDFDFYMPYDTKTFELRIYNNELPVLYYSWSGDSQFGCIGITLNKTNDNTDDLINQNDIIIGQNQQQIEQQEKTNEKLDELNENQKVCSFIDKKNISLNNKYLGSNGVVNDSTSGNGITDYISLSGSTIIVKSTTNRDHNYCFYDANKSVISCHYSDTLVLDSTLSIPKNASYVRFTINTNENKPTFEICKNGNQALADSQEEIKDMEVEAEKTRKGIWETIKNLPSMFLDMLLGLFIPDDMDFINNFVDSIESKLGFIASIPMQFIEFILNLASASWEEVTSISFPSIEIFGYNFWNSQEIDLTEAINIFKPFKYVTDVIAVCLFSNTLLKWWQNFTGGGH